MDKMALIAKLCEVLDGAMHIILEQQNALEMCGAEILSSGIIEKREKVQTDAQWIFEDAGYLPGETHE